MNRRREVFEQKLNNIIDLEVKVQNNSYNQYQIQPTYLTLSPEGVDKWNRVVDLIHTYKFNTIIRTKSGAIANNLKASLVNCYAYDIRKSTSRISLTIIWSEHTYNIVIGRPIDTRPIAPIKAWNIFLEICKKHGIDFNDYKISKEEGKAITDEMKDNTKPFIDMKYEMKLEDKFLDNVHHLDLRSSYPSGLIKMYPEFRPVIEEIYNNRKTDKENSDYYKAILNYVISGCTMSKYRPWYRQWAHIAKFVREFNNERIKKLDWLLFISGREVIGHNTDGIWYRGEIYHGPDEGEDLLQWHNDHVNCLFRSKSAGAYEYIEDDQFNVVMRGFTTLDMTKPRNKWEPGDIFKTGIKEYIYDEESEKLNEV